MKNIKKKLFSCLPLGLWTECMVVHWTLALASTKRPNITWITLDYMKIKILFVLFVFTAFQRLVLLNNLFALASTFKPNGSSSSTHQLIVCLFGNHRQLATDGIILKLFVCFTIRDKFPLPPIGAYGEHRWHCCWCNDDQLRSRKCHRLHKAFHEPRHFYPFQGDLDWK